MKRVFIVKFVLPRILSEEWCSVAFDFGGCRNDPTFVAAFILVGMQVKVIDSWVVALNCIVFLVNARDRGKLRRSCSFWVADR